MDDDYDDNSLLSYPSSSAYKNQDDGYYGVDDSFVYGEDNTFGKYGSGKNSLLAKWARIPRKYKLAGLVGCMLTILLLIIASVLLVIFLSNFLDSGGNSGDATQHSTAASTNPDKTSGPNDGTTFPQPKFPSTYKTDISFVHFVPEQNDEEYFEIVSGNMTLHTDDTTASLYMNASVVYWTGIHHNNQVIINNLTGAYDLTNSRCTFFPDQMYNNMFFWVNFSEQLEQTQIVDEIDCVVWELYFSADFYLQLFIDKESYTGPYQIPVQMIVAFDRTIQQFNFTDFEPITFNRTLLDPPETCLSEHICEDSPAYPFQFYRFRDIEDNKISNRTVSDLAGTTSLLCIVLLADGYRQDTLLSQYNLRVNTTWGQFSYCGRTGCVGGDPFTVGREATLAMKDDPWLGQCTEDANNDGVGSLYSLRADAACLHGQEVGFQGCAWEPSPPVKTVQFSCLMQGATLLQACLSDVNIPFASATQEFKRLFDDCPNVSLPPPDGPQPSPHPHPTAPPPPPSNSQKMVDLTQISSAMQLGPFGFQRVVKEELANYRTF